MQQQGRPGRVLGPSREAWPAGLPAAARRLMRAQCRRRRAEATGDTGVAAPEATTVTEPRKAADYIASVFGAGRVTVENSPDHGVLLRLYIACDSRMSCASHNSTMCGGMQMCWNSRPCGTSWSPGGGAASLALQQVPAQSPRALNHRCCVSQGQPIRVAQQRRWRLR